MPRGCVTKIRRIENIHLWKRFVTRKIAITELSRNRGQSNEIMAWHGCRTLDPREIKTSGVDFRFADVGLWGRGAYFAHNAQYSVAYASRSREHEKSFFLCRIALGKSCDMKNAPAAERQALVTAPKGFDSVTGATGTPVSDVFIVYDIAQSYPEYQVFFRKA